MKLDIVELRLLLTEQYGILRTWERVAEELYQDRVSKTLLWKIVERDHIPTRKHIVEILNLKTLIEVEPCPSCGGACTYDCGTKKVIRKSGTTRKRAPRIEIALSDPVKAVERLEKALVQVHGKEVQQHLLRLSGVCNKEKT